MTGPTPGPWAAKFDETYMIIGGDGATVAQCKFVSFLVRRHIDEVAANARLIAAAPDLLEALKGLMEIAETAMPTSYFLTDSRTKAAREAIASAEGRTDTGADHG